MKKKFTRAEILQGSGCYRYENGKVESIIGDKQEMTIQKILNLEIPLKDKFWFVHNNCELKDIELILLAIGCATIVLPIYESKYPEDKAPREAIQASKDFLNGLITVEELRVKRDAAYDSANLTYADSAYTAYASASADSAYAYAASNSAVVAASAYADDAYKQQLLDFLKYFLK